MLVCWIVCFCVVFFFKQKTAYEMRISDWSSDVCSSDLTAVQHLVGHVEGVGEGGLLVRYPEQVLVRDDDQCVDVLLQLLDAGLGDAHAVQAFEIGRASCRESVCQSV